MVNFPGTICDSLANFQPSKEGVPSGLKHLQVYDGIGGLGGEVPPTSPAGTDPTKLGEAEIT